eukprot:CAMPEP_0174855394 /NCGR_PEP_ID=MMETSP1114-20130205/33181_1 /TAXON_ID=312471 /ORGANISM="Neobodo designis, Strain CCAP 1951/1" /LENGTH=143 /DNA_ID=CAMNT_0016090133 /DNA_START=89 /DNA_END=520 /DNA_ORIENTATION=+
MDALLDAEMRLERLDDAMRRGLAACTSDVPEPGPPVTLADAAAFDAARMRLAAYKTEEARRLAPVAEAINGAFAEAQQSLARLTDAPPEQILPAIAALEAEQERLDAQLVALYAEAAAIDDEMHERIANTAVAAFGPLPPPDG